MLNEDRKNQLFNIDQSTPDRDAELFNKTEYDAGFVEAMGDSYQGSIADFFHLYSNMIPPLQKLGMTPDSPKAWGPNIPASELNKKYGVDTFKDDMTDTQAQSILGFRQIKQQEQARSALYDGRELLGQTAPQWLGGIGGSAVANPLNALPVGQSATLIGKVGQGMLSNATGALLDWSARKALEERTGEEATAQQLLMDIAAGTVIGTAIDIGANVLARRKPFDLGPTPEEMLNVRQEAALKTRAEPQKFETWVKEAHAEYLKNRSSILDSLAETNVKSGIPVDVPALAKIIDPYPMKVDVIELTHPDGTKQRTMVPRSLEEVDFQDWGYTNSKIDPEAVFKVDGEEFDTLERANAIAKGRIDAQVEVINTDGTSFRLNPIDVEAEIKAQSEAIKLSKYSLPTDVRIEVGGIEFDDIGRAAVYAKASNSKISLFEPDGKGDEIKWDIDPPAEFIADRPLSPDQGGKPQFGDPVAIERAKSIAQDPDQRLLIDAQAAKDFREFDTDSVRMKELSDFEKEVNFMIEGAESELKNLGDKAPADMAKHVEAIRDIDKTAEAEDNAFKQIIHCILGKL